MSRTIQNLTLASNLVHTGAPVCYATVDFSSSSSAISGAYPTTGISAADTGGSSRRITIPEMANTTYLVLLSYTSSNDIGTSPCVNDRTTTTFDISGASEGSSRKISFIVFGDLA